MQIFQNTFEMQAIIYCNFSAFSNCVTVPLTRRFNRINTDIFISSGNFYLSKYQPLHTLYNIYKIRKKRMKARMKYPPSSNKHRHVTKKGQLVYHKIHINVKLNWYFIIFYLSAYYVAFRQHGFN